MITDVSRYDVCWNTPSQTDHGSMPLGNGETAVSFWATESSQQYDETQFLSRLTALNRTADAAVSRKRTSDWWKAYWENSFVYVEGDASFAPEYTEEIAQCEKEQFPADAPVLSAVTQGYLLTRYLFACTARGNQPIRFNGLQFTTMPGGGKPFDFSKFALGLTEKPVGEPEFAKKLLDFIIHKNMVMLENIVSIPGIDGILLGSDWGSQRDLLMSPEVWRELIKPGEIREYELIHEAGIDVWVHSCGDVQKIFPDLIEMGVDVLNPLQPECMDIYHLKDTYGDKIAFWGGISTQGVLPFGTPEQVAAETRKVGEYLSKNGGYILAPSQEIQADVPYENLCAMIDTANQM